MSYEALVIDDDSEVRENVAEILDSLGHRYDMATCQEEARELLRRQQYSYYLVDLEIPVRTGKGITCGRQDVIRSGGCGYRLTEWIAVEDGEEQARPGGRRAAK